MRRKMTATWTGEQPRALNEATIEEVRKRIGIPVRYSPRNHNEVSSSDSFRHFARAYGDDNPLYSDPSYAMSSSWGSPIAPPLYPFVSGITRPVELSEAQKAILRSGDPLAGIGQYMCGERWLFARPVRAGDVLWHSETLHSAELRTSTFGGGTGALVSRRHVWEDDCGEPLALRFLDFWHADREGSKRAGKNREIDRPHYSDEDLERIDACYGAQQIRGAATRTIDQVQVGETLGPIAKGPLSVTDLVAWHVGVGWGAYGGGTSRIAYVNRQRVPRFYVRNEYGFWDSAQCCHWDDEWAKRMGHPAPYDYGVMRTNWMVHLITDWMGDDAWIWTLAASVSKFNYMGDMHMISGTVRDVDPNGNTVTLDVQGENQRGEITCEAQIVVILPANDGERARIPDYDPKQVPEASAP
jgi:acyl dehydratase